MNNGQKWSFAGCAKQTYSTSLVDVEGVQTLLSLSGLSLAWLLQLRSVSVEVAL